VEVTISDPVEGEVPTATQRCVLGHATAVSVSWFGTDAFFHVPPPSVVVMEKPSPTATHTVGAATGQETLLNPFGAV
jgi:hypothetical protein